MITKPIALSIALSLGSILAACQQPALNNNPEAPRPGQEIENTGDQEANRDNDADDDDRQPNNPNNNQQSEQDDDDDQEKRSNRNNKQGDDD